jgi:hypothetical protein
MPSKHPLNDSTEVWADEDGFIFFEIDDGEDDLFTCGDIGLGHLLDAIEEVMFKDDEGSKEIALEGYPTIFISRFDDEIEIENRDDQNLWTVGANKDDLVSVLKQFVVEE